VATEFQDLTRYWIWKHRHTHLYPMGEEKGTWRKRSRRPEKKRPIYSSKRGKSMLGEKKVNEEQQKTLTKKHKCKKWSVPN